MIRYCARFWGSELPGETIRPGVGERQFLAPDDVAAMDWIELAWAEEPDAATVSVWTGERLVSVVDRPAA